MKRIVISIIAVLAVIFVEAAPSWAHKRNAPSAKCPSAGSRVLFADAQAEVYTAVKGHGLGRNTVAEGCIFGHNGSYTLGRYEPECLGSSQGGGCGGGVEKITLAGTAVAYEEGSDSENETSHIVVVRDLRSGRVLHKVPTGAPAKPSPEHVGTGSATAIVVKSDGAVAWIAENDELLSKEGTYYEIHAVDKAGGRVLASGVGINPFSLALASSSYRGAPPEVYWTQGGKPASTTLN